MIRFLHKAGWFIVFHNGTIGDCRIYQTQEAAEKARSKRSGAEKLKVIYSEEFQ